MVKNMEFELQNKSPLEFAKQGCEAIMHKYLPQDLPPRGALFYHQGVFLSGMQRLYSICGDKKYFEYIKSYIDSVIGENGEVFGIDYDATQWGDYNSWEETMRIKSLTLLDAKQPVILLYNLLDETEEKKYERAIKTISESMYYWPVNRFGGYWHMMDQHDQMWLDGAYMAGVLSVMYSARFGDERLREKAIRQIFIMYENMRDEKTGLLYHGWDPSKRMKWADPDTGLSGQFWGRAVGWYIVAILDMLDYIPKYHFAVEGMRGIVRELLESLTAFQDKNSGMWFEVLDQINREDNWTESSCSCLFAYSYAKAMRLGIIEKKYTTVLEKAYKGIQTCLNYDSEGYLVINKICPGTCIEEGTYEYYISRKQISNDLHGMGAFVLMCTEIERYRKG